MKTMLTLMALLFSISACNSDPYDARTREILEKADRERAARGDSAPPAPPPAALYAEPSGEHSATTGCNNVSAAQFAEEVVERRIKSPRDAEFADYNEDNVKRSGTSFTYVSYVDSQNGTGATVRTYFKVFMHCEANYLVLDDVKFEQQ
jgi:hypothetical protein